MISAPLTDALELHRGQLNSTFRNVASLHPHLGGELVLQLVRDWIDPLVVSVHTRTPDRVSAVVLAAYDAVLTIAATRLADSSTNRAVLAIVWREVFVAIPTLIANEPKRIIGAVMNAAFQVAANDGRAAERWLRALARVGRHCTTADELLTSGQVLAWINGLAHFRDGALLALATLSASIIAAIFEIPPDRVEALRSRLQRDRWFDPHRDAPSGFDERSRIGAFRGFGGAFTEPPIIAPHLHGWLARSGAEYWFIVADAFGHSLHRATQDEWQAAEDTHREPVKFTGTRLTHSTQAFDLGNAGPITSAARWGDAIACTTAHSHHIVLFAPHSPL